MDLRRSHQDNEAATSVVDLAKWALEKCVRAPAGGVPTYLAKAAGYKDINKVLKYFVISESLINRTEDLEGIRECGSQPQKAVECGSTVGKQMKDRKEKLITKDCNWKVKFEQIAKDDKRLWRRTSVASD